MTGDEKAIVQAMARGHAPAFLVKELRAMKALRRQSATAPAAELYDIYAQRERLQKERTDGGPTFRGFGPLLRRLSHLKNSMIRVATIDTPNYRMVLFTDVEVRTLLGTLYAKIEHNAFWREYLSDREQLAYLRGVQEGMSRAKP